MNLAAGPPPIDQVGTVVSSLGGGHYIPIPASRPIFQSPNQGLSCVYKYTALDSELVFLCKWLEVPNVDPPTNQFFQKLGVNLNKSETDMVARKRGKMREKVKTRRSQSWQHGRITR